MEILSTIHVAAVFFSFGIILLADKQAFSWMRGKQLTLNARLLYFYHRLTWAGLFVLIATGTIMFWPRADYLLTQPLFIMKMLFVGILLVNAVLINRFMQTATTRPFSSLSGKEIAPLIASGAISTTAWVGAVLVAVTIF
jgi:hypothetical protein